MSCLQGTSVFYIFYTSQSVIDFFDQIDFKLGGKRFNQLFPVIVTDNGKNIFPEELEYHLGRNPVVSDSLVYGDADKKGKLTVMANIRPNLAEIRERLGKEDVTDDEVTEVIRKVVDETNRSVPTYKRIVQFTIRKTEFIKTTTAKIQRFRKENREKE